MKLAIDCRMIGSSGIGTYITELLPSLQHYFDCTLLGSSQQCEPFLGDSHTTFCECTLRPFSLKEMYAMPTSCVQAINACDAFYTPYCNVPSGIRVPVYTTIHDVVFLDVPGLTGTIGKLARRYMYARAIRKSRAVFTVSEFSKERIIHHFGNHKPIIVGYNGLSSWITEAIQKPQAVQKTNTLLFVGNIKPHKGLQQLLDAFLKARSKGLTATLTIVGNADNFRTGDDRVVKQIASVTDGSIRFTGRITNEELQHYYQQANLLIQPSLYEGFGIPPLEALAFGTNVVLSDISVFHEIYDALPVTFYKQGDSDDLCCKILETINKTAPQLGEIPYSYSKTADILYQTISN